METRMKDLFETQKQHDEELSEIKSDMEEMSKKVGSVDQNISVLMKQMEHMLQFQQATMSKEKEKMAMDESAGQRSKAGTYTIPPMRQQTSHQPQYQQLPTYRLEFPEFAGENPRSWIHKANRYFSVHQIEEGNRVMHASYYLVGSADLWFCEYVEGRPHIQWELFCKMVLKKILVPGQEDIVMDFTQLMQKSDVATYIEQFEELKSLVRSKHPAISDEFYISCFLKGLKEEIGHLFKCSVLGILL